MSPDNESPTLSKSKSIFAYFTILFNKLCFQVLLHLKISKCCNFLIFEARNFFFQKQNIYLCLNFILEISKHTFQRPQLYLATDSRCSRRSAEKWRRIFMKFYNNKYQFKVSLMYSLKCKIILTGYFLRASFVNDLILV